MNAKSSVCNRLQNEKSPYLLQHKNNPVCWYPWGEEAFERARAENKPIFLSIGYSTCYWCHVMEQDSFEVPEVAELMNKYFVNVKLDREERPDIDQVYMDAVVGLTGRGGWPMSVFLTPDRKPFFGGTYFPRTHFMDLLQRIHEAWQSRRDEILDSATDITAQLAKSIVADDKSAPSDELLRRAYDLYRKDFDEEYGGFGAAPKFPPSQQLALLLRIHRRSDDKQALEMVLKTLRAMARGGIYDHVGGGFARYSTDERWLVPHFEKMLYDNALLAVVYLEAFQLTKDEMFASVARETLDYVLAEMTGKDGGFYSAEDAGEVNKEGEYYVWKADDLKQLLSKDEYAAYSKAYQVTQSGNFEHGTTVLSMADSVPWGDKYTGALAAALRKVKQQRVKREPPHKDDKILAAWNGLMIGAYAKAAQVLKEPRYLEAAQRAAQFIKAKLWDKAGLKRRYRAGESRFAGVLNDYAFLIDGLLVLYQTNFEEQYLRWAIELQVKQDGLLWDEKDGGYFFSAAAEVIFKKKELVDGAVPSGNSVALHNLVRLYALTFDAEYRVKRDRLAALMADVSQRFPSSFPRALIAMDFGLDNGKEIALIVPGGDSRKDLKVKQLVAELQSDFLPNVVLAVGTGVEKFPKLVHKRQPLKNEFTVYVCEEGNCKLPTTDLARARELIGAGVALTL